MSESWLCFFASVFLFSDSYSYHRFSLSSCRPLPSLNPQSTSCQTSGVALRSESQDSECAVGEVAMRGTGFSGDSVAADLLTPKVTVAVVVDPSEGVAEASQDTVLFLPSLHLPASPSAPLGISGQRLDDDVLQQFDATHRLSELTAAWGTFATFVTSFGEKLHVSFF